MVSIRYNYIKPSLIGLFLMQALPCVMNINVVVQLLLNSTLSLLIGCLITVSIGEEDNKNDDNEEEEKMGMKEVLQFPFVASFFLVGLYFLYKVLDPRYVTLLFKINITVGCWFAIGRYLMKNFNDLIFKMTEKIYYKNNFKIKNNEINIHLSNTSIISFLLGGIVCWSYFFTNHWTLNNLLGFVFIITGIKFVKIPNFKTAFLLMWLLFFYDIFWVFGTDVMVSVAKNLDAPIKLLLPYGVAEKKFSMIGLGDIIIPGFLVVLALKYDVDMYLKKNKQINKNEVQTIAKQMSIPYFKYAFIGYIIGILVTNLVMLISKHPQPALLYLVPGTTFPLFIKSLIDRNFKEFFSWEESPEEQKEAVEEKKTK